MRLDSLAADAWTNVVRLTPVNSAARAMRFLSLGLTRIPILSVALSSGDAVTSLKFNTIAPLLVVPTTRVQSRRPSIRKIR